MSDDIVDLPTEAERARAHAEAELHATAGAVRRLGLDGRLAAGLDEDLSELEDDLRAAVRAVAARRTVNGAERTLSRPRE